MSRRLPVCEDSAAIAARIAELRRERMAMLAGCTCPQRSTAGEVVHVSQCPLGPTPPSQMQATLEAMARARARLRQAGVPIRETVALQVETEREEDGRWIAEVPALPGVLVYGATEQEARAKVIALAFRVERRAADAAAQARLALPAAPCPAERYLEHIERVIAEKAARHRLCRGWQ